MAEAAAQQLCDLPDSREFPGWVAKGTFLSWVYIQGPGCKVQPASPLLRGQRPRANSVHPSFPHLEDDREARGRVADPTAPLGWGLRSVRDLGPVGELGLEVLGLPAEPCGARRTPSGARRFALIYGLPGPQQPCAIFVSLLLIGNRGSER